MFFTPLVLVQRLVRAAPTSLLEQGSEEGGLDQSSLSIN